MISQVQDACTLASFRNMVSQEFTNLRVFARKALQNFAYSSRFRKYSLAKIARLYKVSCTVSQIKFRNFRKSYLSKFCKAFKLQGSSIQLLQCFAGTKVVNFCTVLQWTAKHCLLMLENWNIRVHPSQDITFKKKKFKMHTS